MSIFMDRISVITHSLQPKFLLFKLPVIVLELTLRLRKYNNLKVQQYEWLFMFITLPIPYGM